MKKLLALLILFSTFSLLFAQSDLYEIKYDSVEAKIPSITEQILNSYGKFNSVFHFPADGPGFKYKISIFADKKAYKQYVADKTDSVEPKNETVLLQHSAASKSELVIYAPEVDKNILTRQLFNQYLYSFMAEPPAWLLYGASIYFEEYKDTENPWLETAKNLFASANTKLTAAQILEANSDTYPSDNFIPQSWLLFRFLIETPKSANSRLFHDGINEVINNSYSTTDPFLDYYKKWLNQKKFEKDFEDFVSNLHSVREDVLNGINAYMNKDYTTATAYFSQALSADNKNATAAYYTALCYYDQKDYKNADIWYKKALSLGSDPALINWGLGACAYADARYDEATVYLLKAKQLDEATYGKRVDELMQYIPVK
ncbi:MAG: CDC27 family protein [Spirochaetaceae bacterium]|nr:CDC27 family protein [Spirochaetaceae bacterium]